MQIKIYKFTHIILFTLLCIASVCGNAAAKKQTNSYWIDREVKHFPKINVTTANAFQLISHGKPGYLLLDGKWRDAPAIVAYIRQQRLLSNNVTQLNIYGCNFGKGKTGTDAVAYISKNLRVHVAASNNITGKSGDWILEVGNPEFVLSENNYNYNLQAIDTADSDGDGIKNWRDIDDDNDGVTDIDESACTSGQLTSKAGIVVTSDLTYTFNGSANLQRLVDGVGGGNANTTYVIRVPAGTGALPANAWFQFAMPAPTILTFIEIGNYPGQSLFSSTSVYNIEGSVDNVNWITLASNQTYANGTPTYANNNSAKFSMPDNVIAFTYYRIKGISGTGGTGWAQEAYFQTLTCTDLNTDNDAFVNRLDLDLDNDGCSDAFESGAITNTASNYQFSGPVGANGLADILEAVVDNGKPNYISSYQQYATDSTVKACLDSDLDGIRDVFDIDDDNDGVTDEKESACTLAQLLNKSDVTVTSQVTYSFFGTPNIQRLVDGVDGGNANTTYVIGVPSGTLNNTTWLQFQLPKIAVLKLIELGHFPGQTLYTVGSTYNIQGSNDNINWTTLVANQAYTNSAPVYATNNSAKFSIPKNSQAFRFYRIQGVNGTAQAGGGWAQELYFQESTCTDINTDGDALANRLDLDSDGDGCSDALEGGSTLNLANNYQFTGAVGNNGLDNTLEMPGDNGYINYPFTYPNFALDTTLKACLDSDNDGIRDVDDIDDDNDGVEDISESNCKYQRMPNWKSVIVTSQMNFTFNGAASLQRLVDSIDGGPSNSNYVVSAPSGPITNVWFKFELTSSLALKMIELSHTNTTPLFSTGSLYSIQGSNDDTTWTTIVASQSYAVTPKIYASTYSAKFSMLDNTTRYRFYRIKGISGGSGGGWAQETFFMLYNCTDNNTDGDALVNRLDLDSDNDGCSDAVEGGATTNTAIPNYVFTGNVGTNGLDNSLESATDNGNINYPLTYILYAVDSTINACLNSDNDTLLDVNDIDDDNDGILDIVESNCSYKQINNKSGVNITTDMTYSFFGTANIQRLVDGVDGGNPNTTYVIGAPTGDFVNSTWLEFELPEATALKLIELGHYPGQTLYTLGSTYSVQGSNDDLSWTTIVATQAYASSTPVYATNNSAKFSMPNNLTKYQFYRILGISGSAPASGGWAQEAYFQTYTCTDINTDGDAMVNRIDLDSDNDGCSDAQEGGATTNTATNYQFAGTNVGANGLDNSLETAPDNNLTNYVLTYQKYAKDSTARACINSDNDALFDVVYIDDDNDGITDEVESDCSYKQLSKAGIVVTSELSYTFFGTPQTLQRLVDGVDGDLGNTTYVISAPAGPITKTWLEFELPNATALKLIELGHYDNQYLFSTTSQYAIEGSNDNQTWTTIVDTQTYTNTARIYAKNNSAKFSMPDNTDLYRFYRIKGISGGAGFGWAQEAYFQVKNCTDLYTDNDGIPNRIDLDSDNDGCSDAFEGGATTNTANNYQFPANVGTNGLYDLLETTVDNGNTNYTQTYLFATDSTTKACLDSDGDGIYDVYDIDDDNDGIIDLRETNCSYTQLANKSDIVVSSDITYSFHGAPPSLQRLVDGIDGGNGNNTYVIGAPSGTLANTTWLKFELPSAVPLNLIELGNYYNQSLFAVGSTYKIQGSNDNVIWKTIVDTQAYTKSAPVYATNKSAKFTMLNNQTAYRFYRILGINGVAQPGGGWAQEAYFRTSTCTDINTDGDGLVNRLDPDSDNDGCSDALEGGATTNLATNYQFTGNVGMNGLDNSLETTPDDGNTNYTLIYVNYAMDSTIKACINSDNDALLDIFDIDDDNDGILDEKESVCSYKLLENKSAINVTSQMTYQFFGSPQTLQRLVDGIDGDLGNTTYVISAPSGDSARTWLQFELPAAAVLRLIELGHYDNQRLFAVGSTYNIEGSNDGANWDTIVANQLYNNTPRIYATNNSAKFAMPNNNMIYRFYRIQGIEGSAQPGGGWAQEAYFQQYICKDINTDGDALANRIDLDSDNDGCSDALEGGATTNTAANYQFTGNVGTNGLDNSLETATDNGNTNYALTYLLYGVDSTQRACINSDNDTLLDVVDIDDDNDGVPDVAESKCAYTLLPNKSAINVTSEMTYLFYSTPQSLQRLVDGIDGDLGNTTYVISQPTGPINRTWLEFELPNAVDLKLIELGHYDGQRLFSPSSTYSIQGSNDNLNWDTIVVTQAYTNTAPIYARNNSAKFTMPNNNTIYRFYRLQGITGAMDPGVGWAQEAYFQQYTCVDINTDGDGLVNRLDPDADNDGCSDAFESGATTNFSTNYQFPGNNVGVNGLENSLETLADNGSINYTSSYLSYATNNSIQSCLNSDNDTIPDIRDIDDDNDGVLDIIETNCSNKLMPNKSQVVVTTQVPYLFFGTPSLQRLVDGVDGGNPNTTYVCRPPDSFTISNVWFNFELPQPQALNLIEIATYPGQTLFSANSVYNVEGSMDNYNWTTIVANQTATSVSPVYGTNNSMLASMPNNYNYYQFYRIKGVSGARGTGWAQEIYFQQYNCLDFDDDGDNIANRLDTDSDNDGCTDAQESGVVTQPGVVMETGNAIVSGPYSANGFATILQSPSDSNAYNYAYTYSDAQNATITVVCDVPLALSLLSFEAHEYQQTKGWIQWQTSNENSGTHYILEKSTDGKNFKHLFATNGKGATTTNNYSYIDPSLTEGKNLYRLQMISGNGNMNYSDVVSINYITAGAPAQLHPNPTDGIVSFEFLSDGNSNEITLWVDNIVGQRVSKKQVFKIEKGRNRMKLDLSELSQGVYLFNYKTGDNNFGTIKFTKK